MAFYVIAMATCLGLFAAAGLLARWLDADDPDEPRSSVEQDTQPWPAPR